MPSDPPYRPVGPAPPESPPSPGDWYTGDFGLKMTSAHAGMVQRANNKIYDYDLDAILRLGWFRVRIETDGFILYQAIAVVLLAIVVTIVSLAAQHAGVVRITRDHVSRLEDVFKYFAGLTGFLFAFFVL